MEAIPPTPPVPPTTDDRANPLFVVLYLIVFLMVIAYAVYVFVLNFDNYSEPELVRLSYYFVPALLFSIVGIITVRKKMSVIYALCAVPVALVLLVFFFQGIWPRL